MKKIITLFLFLLITTSLFADYDINWLKGKMEKYMVPVNTTGINLKSSQFPSYKEKLNTGAITNLGFNGKLNDKITTDENHAIWGRAYYIENIVLSGGFTFTVDKGKYFEYGSGNVDDDFGYTYTDEEQAVYRLLYGGHIECTFTTDTGDMILVSQSNSAYQRPFELYGVLISSVKPYVIMGASNETVHNIRSNVLQSGQTIPSANIDFKYGLFNNTNQLNGGASVFFDIVLGLPGELDATGTVLTYEGKEYRLTQADDYSVVITMTMKLYDSSNNLIDSVAFTFPIAGYVTNDPVTGAPSVTSDPNLSEASLTARELPGAYNIDLMNDAGNVLDIADINMMATYGANATTEAEVNANIPQNMYIFLSSNSNPTVQGNKFRFKKRYSNSSTTINYSDTNSVGFTLTAYRDGEGIVQGVVFDGTSYLDYWGAGIIGTSIVLTEPETLVKAYVGDWSNVKYTTGQYTKSFIYDGRLAIKTDTAPEYLEAGLYQETIYIHVVAQR